MCRCRLSISAEIMTVSKKIIDNLSESGFVASDIEHQLASNPTGIHIKVGHH